MTIFSPVVAIIAAVYSSLLAFSFQSFADENFTPSPVLVDGLSVASPSHSSPRLPAVTSVAVDEFEVGTDANANDRIWIFSTRTIASEVACANLEKPRFHVTRLNESNRVVNSSLDEYLMTMSHDRTSVVYVHGYRFTHYEAIERGMLIYQETKTKMCTCQSKRGPVDWVIFSWPSAKDSCIINDVREKAGFTDTQGLYLAWLLREHVMRQVPTAMIGYSFGGRVVTGSLHALAGGSLAGRSLNGEPIQDARIDVGLVAPAIDKDWLGSGQYHGLATSNIDHFVLLFNQRDSVLKRYWLLDRDRGRGAAALGFGNLKSFAPRADGSEIFVVARDCSSSIGSTHDELDYYDNRCRAGGAMAKLILDTTIKH